MINTLIVALLFTASSPTNYIYQDVFTYNGSTYDSFAISNNVGYSFYTDISFNGYLKYNDVNNYDFQVYDFVVSTSIYSGSTYITTLANTLSLSATDNTYGLLSGFTIGTYFSGNDFICQISGYTDSDYTLYTYHSNYAMYGSQPIQTKLDMYNVEGQIENRIRGVNMQNGGDYNTGYQVGYSDGYNEGFSADSTAVTIFNGILNIGLVPINFFLAMFNFEILGINISSFVSALLSVCLVIIVIRFISGKKQSD